LQARNQFGLSDYTEQVQVTCGEEPQTPEAPITTRVGNNVIVSWVAPFDNGATILSFQIYIRTSDL
jgi:hypothetical protein